VGEPTPLEDLLINDRYWLGRARGMLDQSIRGRDEAAARLASGVGWLWTVYTGAALVGVALGKQPLPSWTVGVLVAPALLLVAAYGLATWAGLPVEVAFDPRVVQEIQAVHLRASREKQRRLRLAGLAAGLGAVTVAAAVVATATVRPGPPRPSLSAVIQRQPDGQRMALVTGRFPTGAAVTVTVTAEQGGTGPASRLLMADAVGEVYATIPVSSSGQGWRVQASWSEHEERWILTVPTPDPTPHSMPVLTRALVRPLRLLPL
jgi:hypothetical protein